MIDQEKYKQIALKILLPIKEIDSKTKANEKFLFTATRSKSGYNLPEYYLLYFLFVDLLGFKNLGKFEKIAFSIPIDYNGKAFLIEHRKFGIGLFIQDAEKDEKYAEEIVKKINGAVKSARPFYDYIAQEAVNSSKFNINNNNSKLFERFDFLLKLYKENYEIYLKNKGKTEKKVTKSQSSETIIITSLDFEYSQKSNWFAISCIEAFFSWTEHLFIHIAVISQNVTTGKEISNLIDAEWKTKFTSAIPITTNEISKFYNDLLIVRQQLRNFVAHGAFGKNGNAFMFHSNAGAVPVIMNHKKTKNRFSLNGQLSFKEVEVIELIEKFISFLWKDSLEPIMYYTQECELPTILTMASNGFYSTAIGSMEIMRIFSDKLMSDFDNSANMDW
ncbi:hypothetical protein EZJ43_09640 [Pedobacter changchengzhani]|uniref:Uncharacterized protein n=1 Tax=Pedobacter changchengzhani TaxID=2529274 RepID=A0A4R5MLW9_9SPHI|nr:hypothetical protein [Pedobacter changchengzhani]TDG36255.1 hypothetical protein EZJ43_09640 [Pedobacter changchengzhani]